MHHLYTETVPQPDSSHLMADAQVANQGLCLQQTALLLAMETPQDQAQARKVLAPEAQEPY
jgi:hypothetical protein